MAKVFTMLDLSRDVIGSITPTGNHGEDLDRVKRIEERVEIIDGLMMDLVRNIDFAKRPEASIKHLGEESIRELTQIKDFLDEVLEEQ